mgnify:CR=1 FL=1
MIYNLSFFSDIAFSIKQALRTFSCKIAAILYDWIIDLYNVFMYTARAEILSNEFIQKIYNKVGMILGIFMVFKLAFSLIQALVDPSKFTDGRNGFASIIKRSVIAIVLLGITPSLFRTAFQFQNLIAGTENNTDNLIYKLIVGEAPSHSADSFGRIIASKLYFGFYKENEPYKLDNGIEIEYPDGGGSTVKVDNYENLVDNVSNGTKQFSDTVDYLSITSSGEYVIDWNGLFAIGMAIAMIWILVTYCIQVATRVIQLAYLQLVAPVPILSYISDPEGAFKNWTKQCLTTYLDLFIRLAIIYFIITVSTQILEAWDDTESILYQSTGLDPIQDSSTMFWVVIFLIIGLLMFGKRVPELLKELFPNFGGGAAGLGFGVKKPKDMIGDIPLIGGATNKVLGYAGGLGKRFGKFAWNHTGGALGRAAWNRTGGKIPKAYERWKENRKNAAEIKEQEKAGERLYNKYGDGADAFKNEGFRNSYLALKAAKDENRKAENDYEIAKASGDAEAIKSAVKRKNAAAKALSEAQETHDNMRKRYGRDKEREDQIKMYKSMHPTGTRPSGGNNQGNGGNSVGQNSAPPQNSQSAPPQNIPQTQNTQQQSQIPGRPEQYDERIEYATNKYNELVDNGASDDELQQQLETLRNLNDGKEQAEKYYREIDNNIDEANERNNDGYGGQ